MVRISMFSWLLLRLRHLLYAQKGQEESPKCRFWAESGKPRPQAYILIRELYDSLRFAHCPGARVFSYESLHNLVLMYPPDIPEPYTGKVNFGGFMVMTDHPAYADLLRKKLKGGISRRYHYMQVIETGRFDTLADYLAFLETVVFIDQGAFLGKTALGEKMDALKRLCLNQEQPDKPPGQPAAASSQPETKGERLAIDFDTVNLTTHRQDTWI